MNKTMKTVLLVIGGLIVLFGLIQLVPYGHTYVNPAVIKEPNWNTPETRALAKTACFDCHSNESVYPWTSRIAPASWLIRNDIDEARSAVNFSEWDGSVSANELTRNVLNGDMPPFQYKIMHPEARLTQAQREQLAAGFEATLAK